MAESKKPLTARQRLMVRIEQTKQHLADVERHLAGNRDAQALTELRFTQALLIGAVGELALLTAKGATPFPQRYGVLVDASEPAEYDPTLPDYPYDG